MADERGTTERSTEQHASGTCVCQEVLDHVGKCFGVSPEVKQHLMNSRVEFLKAIRAVIDQRIERLSGAAQRGTRVTVE
ncbi:MAG TPA: hypothetical protein VNK23_06500 [Candidatus Dormibacteraeota bacterium]|nr:hypothetical protein [Candidatus Dormibacteraeota bacterium]